MSHAQNIRVEYRVDATINLGNFENAKPGYTASADVPDGVAPEEVIHELKNIVDPILEQDYQDAKK